MEALRIDDAGVGDGIGHEDDAGRAVVVEIAQRQLEASVEIGVATGAQACHHLCVVLDVALGGHHPATGQLVGAGAKRHDAEAVVRPEVRQRLQDPVCERLELSRHASGAVEHEHVVGTTGDGLQVEARRHHHHEGTRLVGIVAKSHDLDASGQVILQAVVEDQVAVELRALPLQVHPVVAIAELIHDGLALEARHADVVDGYRGLELEIEREEPLHQSVRDPEALGDLIGSTIFQGIRISTHIGVDMERLVVDEAQARLIARADGRDPKLEGLVAVLGGQASVAAPVALLLVDALGLRLGDHLPMDLGLSDGDHDLRQAGASRHRKGVDPLEIHGVRVVEGLGHLGAREAVVDHDVHVVMADLDRGVGRANRGEGSRRGGGPRDRRQGDSCDQCLDSKLHAGISCLVPPLARGLALSLKQMPCHVSKD